MIQITEFMVVNCVIEFICYADLPLCNTFLFGHSFLKKKKEQNQQTNTKTKKKTLNQQTLFL